MDRIVSSQIQHGLDKWNTKVNLGHLISCILTTHLLVMPENVAELPGSVGCWSTNNS